MVVPARSSAEEHLAPPENVGIFETAEVPSIRPTGIAIAIALLVLCFCFVVLFGVGIYVRKKAAQQVAEAVSLRAATPSVQPAPRSSMFPLSLPSLRSKPNVFSRSSSTEHILTTLPLHKEFSDTTTLASSSKSSKSTKSTRSKDSKFSNVDLEAQARRYPLPPPPSYQDIHVSGPVRSISGSSWITEGPVTVEEPISQVHGGGRRGVRGSKRHGGNATRRL